MPTALQMKRVQATPDDEYYTRLCDINEELKHYKPHFKDKVVLCNCDDPRVSNFFHYFAENFEALGLKRLIATCYKHQDIELFSDYQSDIPSAQELCLTGPLAELFLQHLECSSLAAVSTFFLMPPYAGALVFSLLLKLDHRTYVHCSLVLPTARSQSLVLGFLVNAGLSNE